MTVLPSRTVPSAAIRLYDELRAMDRPSSAAWRDCAFQLRAAAAVVPGPFVTKYTDRADDAAARAVSP